MNMEEIRKKVGDAYPGTWPSRVAMMPNNQVIAIYRNLEKRKDKKVKEKLSPFKQLNIFDVFGYSILPKRAR